MKWNIKDIKNWKYDKHPIAASIPESGNAEYYKTGGWRSSRPVLDRNKCTQCLICWIYCPDSSIMVEGVEITGFDYDHCKGCGICSVECPRDAIQMQPEKR